MSDADHAALPPPREGEAPAAPQPNLPVRKDIWDKLPAITGLLAAFTAFAASVIIGLIGNYFTQSHQQTESRRLETESVRNTAIKKHESELNEVKIFETFIGHLQIPEQDFRLAVLGIETLNPELGQRVLQYYARYSPDDRRRIAREMIEERSIELLNNWNTNGVMQVQPRLPAYLKQKDYPNVPEDKRPQVLKRCQEWEKNGPKMDRREKSIFQISLPFFISEIRNYHFNGNCGSDGMRLTTVGPAGLTAPTIGLRHLLGGEIGRWRAQLYHEDTNKKGEEGVKIPSGWIAYPGIVLLPGAYEVTDSDESTWSFNEDSQFAGISLVLAMDSGR